ncbi:MAG: HIT family protein [Clostridia bacterium]|nr:HIT family protein [Deltaproteobacteria bacterium]
MDHERDGVSVTACAECAYLQGEGAFAGYPRRDIGSFVVHAKIDRAAVPGWLVIAPRRHLEALTALTEDEAASLGPLIKRCSAALEKVTQTAKVYVASFNEALAHVHIHVIARPANFAPTGPHIFMNQTAVETSELIATAQRALHVLEH